MQGAGLVTVRPERNAKYILLIQINKTLLQPFLLFLQQEKNVQRLDNNKKKPRMSIRTANLLLTACVILLCIVMAAGISQPMRFSNERARREKAVIECMTKIRTAEEAYCRQTGHYARDLRVLVRRGLLADSLRFIPCGNGKKFLIETSYTSARTGARRPVMQCSATYDDYLGDMPEEEVSSLKEQADEGGTFPGVSFGAIDSDNGNAGSWEE